MIYDLRVSVSVCDHRTTSVAVRQKSSVPFSSSLRTQPLSWSGFMWFFMISGHSHCVKATDGSFGWSFTTHRRNEMLEVERKFEFKLCTHPRKHASRFVHACIMYSEAALKIQQHNKEKDGTHRSHVTSCSKFSLFPRAVVTVSVEVLRCWSVQAALSEKSSIVNLENSLLETFNLKRGQKLPSLKTISLILLNFYSNNNNTTTIITSTTATTATTSFHNTCFLFYQSS